VSRILPHILLCVFWLKSSFSANPEPVEDRSIRNAALRTEFSLLLFSFKPGRSLVMLDPCVPF
jgi:hypothetical protein